MSNSTGYDLVLLDADGTLFDFDAAAEAAFRAAHTDKGLGSSFSVDELFAAYRVINHGIWAELERGEIDKETLKAERFRRLFAEFSIQADAVEFSAFFLERLAEGAQLIPGAEDFVRALVAAGKCLAIITNGISAVQRGRFARSPFGSLIPALLISEELGAEKPARAFFSEAFRRLGRAEGDTAGVVVVGDSWSADIVGALGFGLDAVWFNPAGKLLPTEVLRNGISVVDARTYADVLAAINGQ
ncbi:MAG: YjjG family noncanonical pyrimidine nucleotidase [Treponemataceae bacterium]